MDKERLRAALGAALSAKRTDTQGECPSAERLLDAFHGNLPVDERTAVIDHMSHCAICSELWPLAGRTPSPAPTRSSGPRGR